MATLRPGETPSRSELARTVLWLSVPAILSELSTTLMQYIDAGMVGSLGAHATAAIGLVESTVWLLSGWAMCAAVGFTVLVAQLVGANRDKDAREVLRQAIVTLLLFGIALSAAGAGISGALPSLLGAGSELWADASSYFFVCSLSMVPVVMARLGTGMLQCSGDMRTPSVLNVLACVLDVCFNAALIYPSRELSLAGLRIHVPGAGLGITGAALGSLLAQSVVAVLLLWFACVRSPHLGLHDRGSWHPRAKTLRSAFLVSGPMFLERTVMSAAYIAGTVIVAPLGTISVAANSLATTAEAVCYMPGMGMSAAATTLVGQAMGAGRKDLARSFARISTVLGMAVMALMGALMFAFAPSVMGALTPNESVAALGVKVLRIEAFAEPLFGASIVGAGALRGAADTFVPSVIVMASMWGVRITLASIVAPIWGLTGVWVVMATELCVRGTLFLVRLLRGKWLNRDAIA